MDAMIPLITLLIAGLVANSITSYYHYKRLSALEGRQDGLKKLVTKAFQAVGLMSPDQPEGSPGVFKSWRK